MATRIRWADEIMDEHSQLFKNAEGRVYQQSSDGTTSWLDGLRKTYTSRTSKIDFSGCERAVLLSRMEATRSGACLFWQLRDIQNCLSLVLTRRYEARWISNTWDSWKQWATEVARFPSTEQFIRSHESHTNRLKAKKEVEDCSMMEYSVSTSVLLILLCKWSIDLKKKAKAESSRFLKAIVQTGVIAGEHRFDLPSPDGIVDASSTWPSPDQSAFSGYVHDCKIFMNTEVVAAIPDLQAELRRIG